MRTKAAAVLSLLILLPVLSACGKTEDAAEEKEVLPLYEQPETEEPVQGEEESFRGRVLLSVPEESGRWKEDIDYFSRQFRNAGFSAEVLPPEKEGERWEEALEKALSEGVDLLILSPEGEAFPEVIGELEEASVPIVVYETPLKEMPEGAWFVGRWDNAGNTENEALVVYSVGLDLMAGERPDERLIRASSWDFPCSFDAVYQGAGGNPAFLLYVPDP